jgi:hypothetical protein
MGKKGETSCEATDIYDECCGATNVPARMSSTGLFHKLDNPIYKSATRARRAAYVLPPRNFIIGKSKILFLLRNGNCVVGTSLLIFPYLPFS